MTTCMTSCMRGTTEEKNSSQSCQKFRNYLNNMKQEFIDLHLVAEEKLRTLRNLGPAVHLKYCDEYLIYKFNFLIFFTLF